MILGEIVAQHLEYRLKQKVDRRLNLGGTLLVHEAIAAGQLDVYPEYTGTALTAVLKAGPEPDAAAVFERVRQQYIDRYKLDWLPGLGFDNSFAMVIRKEETGGKPLATLSDAEASGSKWRLGVGYEFQSRPDGLPALNRSYKLEMPGTPVNMDLGLLYRALEQKQVDLIAANATDGLLSTGRFTVLRDDRKAFPPYEAALVVRPDADQRFPGFRKALLELSGKLSAETMRKLNYEIDGHHKNPADVAAGFLRSAGLAETK
ncbi:MAG: ABC transporter substrate-binding protein [Pirellulaceae bacterium]|nr:ABC transporter substrate-binding protein [Pirellulaceae bacterium]